MQTLGDKLAASRGIGPGFDFLRVTLSVSVVAWHVDAVMTVGGRLDGLPVIWFPGYAILLMFFGLSGFLIAGSAERLRLGDFLLNRGLRIFPALAVEIVLSAFVLGPLLTTLTLGEYFSAWRTWYYLTNIVGLINYQLPGVFSGHPTDFVNVSLWTVPYEFLCYAVMSGIMVFGLLRRPGLILLGAGLIVAAGLGVLALGTPVDGRGSVHGLISRAFTGHQSRLMVGFLLGIAAFVWRHRIPYSPALAGLCVAVCVVVALLGPPERLPYPVTNLLAAPALIYLTAFLGVSRLPTLPLFHRGDYSYGIYLYGFPIQQVVYELFPHVRNPVLQLVLAFVAIAAFAAFSWHCVEKPVLRLRKRFSFVGRMRLEEDAARPAATVAAAVPAGPDGRAG